MPRMLFTPSTTPAPSVPSNLRLFIQRAQLELVYSRRRANRLPLHDSFRLTLDARQRSRESGVGSQEYKAGSQESGV